MLMDWEWGGCFASLARGLEIGDWAVDCILPPPTTTGCCLSAPADPSFGGPTATGDWYFLPASPNSLIQ